MNEQIHTNTHTHTHTHKHTQHKSMFVLVLEFKFCVMLYICNMCELLQINLHLCFYTHFNITFFCDSISYCPAYVVIMCSCMQMISAVTSPANQVQFIVSCNVFCICYHTLFCLWLPLL